MAMSLQQLSLFDDRTDLQESMTLKTTYINNRRYLGNKYRLLPFIKSIVLRECGDISSIADIFAGTGAVASAFTDKKIITNDILYSNYICHFAWFSPEKYSREKIEKYISYYNSIETTQENYMSENFADTFFSRSDCRKIGYIREDIENLYNQNKINARERALLITSLLYAVDKIANTCGHYDAYRQNAEFDKTFILAVPLPSEHLNRENICYNLDANELVKSITADLIYIDPPYNSRQYCDAYHLLENLAKWEKTEVTGVARKMDRSHIKSDYCTSKATAAFEDLINNINAKYILFSYNNMAQKGDDRSNAKISDDDIMRILSAKGTVKVFSEDYKAFTAGKSIHEGNEERLFLCVCSQKNKTIQSPLNYTGGKYNLLPQILPHFPENINTFIDLFCGGCNVGINVNAEQIIFNDNNFNLIYLYNTFKNLDKSSTFEFINNIIDKYNLSKRSQNGYDFYKCNSADGLGDYNRDKYLKLREDFNNSKNQDYYYYIMLYVLIIYSFNNQIRFNSKGEFNLPVGKRDFNMKMQDKLSDFIDRLQNGNYSFLCADFKKFDVSQLTENDFIYADPPYLITCASYNEQNGWNEDLERDLLNFLDKLHARKIKFALSNVLSSDGKKNTILSEWLEKYKEKYKAIPLDFDYSNSNYQKKNKSNNTDEVLIINY